MGFSKVILQRFGTFLLFGICAIGIYMRFYQITESHFFYYDEGYYLNFNRKLLEMIQHHLPLETNDLYKALTGSAIVALGSTKALWLFLMDLRVYFLDAHAWYFPRVLSAIFGVLALPLTYLFARRYYNSHSIGLLSMGILAIFPSHVFYSRMALQEPLSTLFFLGGFYFYLFPQKSFFRTLLSSVCFAGAYYTNYRLLILPIFIVSCEIFLSVVQNRKINYRKLVWNIVLFLIFIFLMGNLGRATNTYTIFSWVLHQAQLAKENMAFLNYFSYPYYIFRLESVFFGTLFFGNVYFMLKGKWTKVFPFFIACFYMFLFSFAMEKGVRYLCVIIPFMVMSVSALVVHLFCENKSKLFQKGLVVFTIFMMINHLLRSAEIMHFQSDYKESVENLLEKHPGAKLVSTQKFIQNLYTHRDQIEECPHIFHDFQALYFNGYRYFILGPQAYIANTRDQKRFSPLLEGYLAFINEAVPPYQVYPHFNRAMLERFVWEHSQNLQRSHQFLAANANGELGALKVYDMKVCLAIMSQKIVTDQMSR